MNLKLIVKECNQKLTASFKEKKKTHLENNESQVAEEQQGGASVCYDIKHAG